MTTPVLICDDSSVARKQMAKSLPKDWDVEVSFATNGHEALELIRQGKGDILFLDLNMPEMDGYQVLEEIHRQELPTVVIVVSGDIQPDARARVMKMGAMEFIKKPIAPEKLETILRQFGLFDPEPVPEPVSQAVAEAIEQPVSELEVYQEIANVAMGQAADLLARLLDVFVVLPIPRVNLLEVTELQMALQAAEDRDTYSAVCQGFIGAGISGEALLLFHDSSFEDMARLMQYQGEVNEQVEMELLMDVASILIGACIKGIAEQLDVDFSQGHPVVLGQHVDIGELLKNKTWRWKQTLTIEICYSLEGCNVACDLLLLFTEDSLPILRKKIAYLM
ncbi:response regulator [Hahella sp. SMD15-11]|uniref:Response regulator n=1 Tax=Thermohahella caldifontis TaxID=3142973 RepID=A0AB39V0C2_9GAMM